MSRGKLRMAYLVFARKYRPHQFNEVIGQAHITRTLSNAIASGRLAHAILLAGPRGTGKTTVARIIAKCMNCKSGATATPCGQCQSCREITIGNAVDVFEIDGASNNKVENVRELRENAKYMPAHSPYKIYIIDEVHMLSDAAFNALLKILEEPPAHVLFLFATTEPNKIPITILSRCQRYDFRRVDIDAIIDHMAGICQKEGIDISESALALIAREADGGIRDALSLLDQIVTCSTGSITDDQIIDILGVIDRKIIFDVADALFKGDMAALLAICDQMYRQGRHLARFYAELIEHFRNLLVVKMGGAGKALADVPGHEKELMAGQVENISEPYLNQILNMLFGDEWRIRQSISPRHALEMTFFKLLQVQPAMSIDTLIEKLDLLRQGVETGSSHTPPAPFPETDPPQQNPPKQQTPPSGAAPKERDSAKGEAKEAKPAPDTPYNGGPTASADRQETPATETRPQAAPAESFSDPGADAAVIGDDWSMEDIWKALYTRISRESPALGACLTGSTLRKLTEDRLEIEVRSADTNINLLNRKKSAANLEKICSDFIGRPVKIKLRTDKARQGDNPKKQANRLREEALNHPLVEAAIKTFNGKIVDIKILPTGGKVQ